MTGGRTFQQSQRGLTLIELLASITLLTLIAVSGAAWLKTTTERAAVAERELQWQRATSAVLDQIADDLIGRDRLADNDEEPVRVTWQYPRLQIATRTPGTGSITRSYRWSMHEKMIVVSASGDEVGALRGVETFECTFDDDALTLRVVMAPIDESLNAVGRSFALP